MEKCEFCSRMVLFGKKDVNNLLGGEADKQSVLHIGVSDYGSEENMMEMNVPINYCPRCGKKL